MCTRTRASVIRWGLRVPNSSARIRTGRGRDNKIKDHRLAHTTPDLPSPGDGSLPGTARHPRGRVNAPQAAFRTGKGACFWQTQHARVVVVLCRSRRTFLSHIVGPRRGNFTSTIRNRFNEQTLFPDFHRQPLRQRFPTFLIVRATNFV